MPVVLMNHDGSRNKDILQSFGRDPVNVVFGRFTFSAAYVKGGESIAADLGDDYFPVNLKPEDILFGPVGGYFPRYNETTGKVLLVGPGAMEQAFIACKGCANGTNHEDADQAAEPTNGHAVAALAAVAAGAWAHGAITEPDHPRSVCITIANDSGGPLDLFEGVSTFTVTGHRNGILQTELITVTNDAASKAMATGKYRYKYGLLPFDDITDITLDNVPADGIKIGAGLGPYFGLNFLPEAVDALHLNINNVAVSGAAKLNTARGTVNVGAIADGQHVTVKYFADEVLPGSDLGVLAFPFVAIGR
jgi:hypothetical protein